MLNQRIEIFYNAKMISEDEKNILEKWVDLLKEINCQQEALERLITHCAMMMRRQKNNEVIADLNDEIFASIQGESKFDECLALYEKMKHIYEINETEERYILLHLCTCLSEV